MADDSTRLPSGSVTQNGTNGTCQRPGDNPALSLLQLDRKEQSSIDTERSKSVPAITADRKFFIFRSLKETISMDEVPPVLREPHVLNGFRVLNEPWSYYFSSMFQLHNETVNIWTHILAFFLVMIKIVDVSRHVDFVNDRYSWPLLGGYLCSLVLYALSSMAHCLHAKSLLVHYIAFMTDYAGIALYSFGSVILHIWYCSDPIFYNNVKDFFIPSGIVLACLISFCLSFAKIVFVPPFPVLRKTVQMLPILGMCALVLSPIVAQLRTCYIYHGLCNESAYYHGNQIIWLIISGVLFAFDAPQRWLPGSCDYFFRSHQLFHLAIMLTTLYQMEGVFLDFKSRSSVFRSRPIPSFASSFGPIMAVVIFEIICILGFLYKVKRSMKVHEEKSQ